MKVILLAAGKGSRLTIRGAVPKPFFPVKGKSILWWSLKSFHPLVTAGVIKKSDIFVITLIDHRSFTQEKELLDFFGDHNPWVEIPSTSSPAESLWRGLEILSQESKLPVSSEPILVSDSDHYIPGIWILRALEQSQLDPRLWLHPKSENDLSWSHIKFRGVAEEKIFTLVEKPLAGIDYVDYEKGVIGLYYFPNQLFLREAIVRCKKLVSQQELYISEVFNSFVQIGNYKNIETSITPEFYPLGNDHQVEQFLENWLESTTPFDAPCLFVDYDGVIVLHQGGFHSKPSYEFLPSKVIVPTLEALKHAYSKGVRIYVVTSRPKFLQQQIINELKQFGICFDEVICGLGAGQRVIVNDLKPLHPNLPMALAKNLGRNEGLKTEDIVEIFQMNSSQGELKGGGSGANVRKIKLGDRVVVRKSAPAASDQKFLNRIAYQAQWYEEAYELLEFSRVPQVTHKTLSLQEPRESSFDMEYLEGIIPLWKLELLNQEKIFKLVSKSFDELYSKSATIGFVSELKQAILQTFDSICRTSVDEFERFHGKQDLSLSINGDNPLKVLTIIETLVAFTDKLSESRLSSSQSSSLMCSIVHGDPTFENLHFLPSDNKIVFLDPVGTFIDPRYLYQRDDIGRTFPLFDFSRLQLSTDLNYEKWNLSLADFVSSQWNENCLVIETTINPRDLFHFGKIETTELADVYTEYSKLSKDLLLASTLLRILRYKKKLPAEQSILLLSIGLIFQDLMQAEEFSSLFS